MFDIELRICCGQTRSGFPDQSSVNDGRKFSESPFTLVHVFCGGGIEPGLKERRAFGGRREEAVNGALMPLFK